MTCAKRLAIAGSSKPRHQWPTHPATTTPAAAWQSCGGNDATTCDFQCHWSPTRTRPRRSTCWRAPQHRRARASIPTSEPTKVVGRRAADPKAQKCVETHEMPCTRSAARNSLSRHQALPRAPESTKGTPPSMAARTKRAATRIRCRSSNRLGEEGGRSTHIAEILELRSQRVTASTAQRCNTSTCACSPGPQEH